METIFNVRKIAEKSLSKAVFNLFVENKENLRNKFNVFVKEDECLNNVGLKVFLEPINFSFNDDLILYLIDSLKNENVGHTNYIIEIIETITAFKEAKKEGFDSVYLFIKEKGTK